LNTAKYENAILYLCDKLGGQIEGKTKLYKLLYFIDFDRYKLKESKQTITGDSFKKWDNGPVPQQCDEIIDGMIKSGKIEKTSMDIGFSHPLEVFVAKEKPDIKTFSAADQFVMNYVIVKYGSLNGTELASITHEEAPFVATEIYHSIPFDYALLRQTNFNDVINIPAMRDLVLEMAHSRDDLFDDALLVDSFPASTV
jgi:uncharacterized phage-associated protein